MARVKKRMTLKHRIVLILLGIEIPFLVLLWGMTRQIADDAAEYQAQTQTQALMVYRQALENGIREIENTIYQKAWAKEDPESFARTLLRTGVADLVYIWDGKSREGTIYGQGLKFSQAERALKAACQEGSYQNEGWQYVRWEKDEDPWLIRVEGDETFRYGVAANIQEISYRAQREYGMAAPVVFLKEAKAITDAYWVRQYADGGKVLARKRGYAMIKAGNKRYLTVGGNFMTMELCYAAVFNYNGANLNALLLLWAAAMLFTFVLAWTMMQRSILDPLNRLLGVMKKIRTGDTTARSLVTEGPEFQEVSATFNEMVDKINSLRIEVYEKQLAADKSRMNALRSQIRRHFFLNCLKSIYGMTLTGDLEDIKTMVLLLSTHLRYTLDFSTDGVPLREELKMCRNYMDLQGVGQEKKPVLETVIDADLLDFLVPPVSLLTILENCCKYANRLDEPLKVTIVAKSQQMDGERFVNCYVQDNGPGFQERLLFQLNNQLESLAQEGHVGFANLMERMRILYGEDCSIWFGNYAGARVVLLLPQKEGI